MKKTSFLILLAIILSSCSHLSLDFTKRKYRKGYNFDLSSTKEKGKRQFAINKQEINFTKVSNFSKVETQKKPASILLPEFEVEHLSSQRNFISQKNTPIYMSHPNSNENGGIENYLFPEKRMVEMMENSGSELADSHGVIWVIFLLLIVILFLFLIKITGWFLGLLLFFLILFLVFHFF